MLRCVCFLLSIVLSAPSILNPAQAQDGFAPFTFERPALRTTNLEQLPSLLDQPASETDAHEQKELSGRYTFANRVAVSIDLSSGEWKSLDNGDRVWTLGLRSRDGVSISLHFDTFNLPPGATLHVYPSDTSSYEGPFYSSDRIKDGALITLPVPGNEVFVEYYEPAQVYGIGDIHISHVSIGFRRSMLHSTTSRIGGGFNSSAYCNVNINCTEGMHVQDEKRAVAMIVTDDGTGICSGALINTTRQDKRPFFLTAFHCADVGDAVPYNGVLSQKERKAIQNWIFVFNFESPGCTSKKGPTWQVVRGASVRAAYNRSDMLLLELDKDPSPNFYPYFAGWSRATHVNPPVTAIHHPAGDIKKVSVDHGRPSHYSYRGGMHWYVASWDVGSTEPGSSGGPLFDSRGLIIGQDHAGNRHASCHPNEGTYFGSIAGAWEGGGSRLSRLRDWLDPAGKNPSHIQGTYGRIPPKPPSNLRFINAASAGAQVSMKWSPSQTQGVRYEVYRCPSYYRNCASYGQIIHRTYSTSFTDPFVKKGVKSSKSELYKYRVRSTKNGVNSNYTSWISTWGNETSHKALSEEKTLIPSTSLASFYPNPTANQTSLLLDLDQPETVSLQLFNLLGQIVWEKDYGRLEKGRHQLRIGAALLPSGVYLSRIQIGNNMVTRKLIKSVVN